jgi:hypothetical protein
MNIFFDVDETLIAYDGSLRPGTRSVFERLVSDGHHVYIWSGRGVRTGEVHRAGLGDLVSGIYQKPLNEFEAGVARIGIPVFPDFVIDDYPGIVEFFGGLCIRPYHGGAQSDNELSDLPELVRGLESAGGSPREADAPRAEAPGSAPRGKAKSWPCRCSLGLCTIYWGLWETGPQPWRPRAGSRLAAPVRGAPTQFRAGHDRGCEPCRRRGRARACALRRAPWRDCGAARAASPRSQRGSSRRTIPGPPGHAR